MIGWQFELTADLAITTVVRIAGVNTQNKHVRMIKFYIALSGFGICIYPTNEHDTTCVVWHRVNTIMAKHTSVRGYIQQEPEWKHVTPPVATFDMFTHVLLI